MHFPKWKWSQFHSDFIEDNAFENVCQLAAILFLPQWVNPTTPDRDDLISLHITYLSFHSNLPGVEESNPPVWQPGKPSLRVSPSLWTFGSEPNSHSHGNPEQQFRQRQILTGKPVQGFRFLPWFCNILAPTKERNITHKKQEVHACLENTIIFYSNVPYS